MMPDGLRHMFRADYDQMPPENGEGIHLDVVHPPLFAFVLKMELFFRAVVGAEEALAGGYRLGIGLRGGRRDAAGIELRLDS